MYGYNAEPPIAIPIYTVLPYCVIYTTTDMTTIYLYLTYLSSVTNAVIMKSYGVKIQTCDHITLTNISVSDADWCESGLTVQYSENMDITHVVLLRNRNGLVLRETCYISIANLSTMYNTLQGAKFTHTFSLYITNLTAYKNVRDITLENARYTHLKNIWSNGSIVSVASTHTTMRNISSPYLILYNTNQTTIRKGYFFNMIEQNTDEFPDTATSPAIVRVLECYSLEMIECEFTANTVTAVNVVSSEIYLSGDVVFLNNTAIVGPAFVLQSTVLKIRRDGRILFKNNHANYTGGVLYIESEVYIVEQYNKFNFITPGYEVKCPFQLQEGQFKHFTLSTILLRKVEIYFMVEE